MSIPLYRDSLKELHKRRVFPNAFYNFCNEHPDAIEGNLKAATSCLSIGAGLGDVDSFIIQKFMPALRSYHAVEPDAENMRTLHENIGKVAHARAGLSTYFYTDDANTWEGLGQQVDVIICICVLYYMKDIKSFLKKCHSWLNPGGSLWLVVADLDVIFVPLAEIFELNRSSMVENPPRGVLSKLDFHQVAEYNFPTAFNLEDVNVDFLRILLFREPTEDEMNRFKQFVEDKYSKDNYINKFTHEVFLCKK